MAISYKKEFYGGQQSSSLESARHVVPYLIEEFQPRSVIDIGCGTGPWLKAFLDSGINDCLGIDGDWVKTSMLLIPPDKFQTAQLTNPPNFGRTFDLALSVEVAEHLPQSAAEEFVQFLTGLAPIVAFSAAIPGQGGTFHLNEQWQSYWCRLFQKYNYLSRDSIRNRIWSNPNVCYWYAQNLIVYVNREYAARNPFSVGETGSILDVVHPRMFQDALRPENLEPRNVLRAVPRAVKQLLKSQAKRMLGRQP